MYNLCCFVVKLVLLRFTHFCHEIYFVAIYALLCGEKLNQKLCLWRKKRQISGMFFDWKPISDGNHCSGCLLWHHIVSPDSWQNIHSQNTSCHKINFQNICCQNIDKNCPCCLPWHRVVSPDLSFCFLDRIFIAKIFISRTFLARIFLARILWKLPRLLAVASRCITGLELLPSPLQLSPGLACNHTQEYSTSCRWQILIYW